MASTPSPYASHDGSGYDRALSHDGYDHHSVGPLPGLGDGPGDMLKSLGGKKSTREGTVPKRRGPKPDAKPALTRRQELNRQAQRTHRERKELYVKALEDEVLRLRESFTAVTQDKERLAEENSQLKLMLHQHGLGYGSSALDGGYAVSRSVSQASSSHTPPPPPVLMPTSHGHPHHMIGLPHQQRHWADPQVNCLDYSQAGIDFVLTLERPCMDHLPFILGAAQDTDGAILNGHALMASCPPRPFPELAGGSTFRAPAADGAPAATTTTEAATSSGTARSTWELSTDDLAKLLDLSKKLNLEGEITPVMAWGVLMNHPRLGELSPGDIQGVVDDLRDKIRAVMEEFELRDALDKAFAAKAQAMSTD